MGHPGSCMEVDASKHRIGTSTYQRWANSVLMTEYEYEYYSVYQKNTKYECDYYMVSQK